MPIACEKQSSLVTMGGNESRAMCVEFGLFYLLSARLPESIQI